MIETYQQEKKWYIVAVQSNREDAIKKALERQINKNGLSHYFGQIVIPVERYQEIKVKNGKKTVITKERKLYPGYIVVELAYNEAILSAFRETAGVGTFVGSNAKNISSEPTPMSEKEVERIMGWAKKETVESHHKPQWIEEGCQVNIINGTFMNMMGVIKKIKENEGKVCVEVMIFGRPVMVELEYYQVSS
jgi:transcriptional antiterminator NusG